MNTNWENVNEYIEYLRGTLVPELRDSGSDATAYDFEDAVSYIVDFKRKVAELMGFLRGAGFQEKADEIMEWLANE